MASRRWRISLLHAPSSSRSVTCSKQSDNRWMRPLIQRFTIVVLARAWAHVASAQTADEIIEKSITAMGGRAAMEKIKSRVMSGTITLRTPVGEVPGTIEVINAAPNKARTLIKADLSSLGAGPMQIDQRFNGTDGYVLDSLQGDRPIT